MITNDERVPVLIGGAQEEDVDDMVCTLGQRYRSAAILGDVPVAPFAWTVSTRFEVGARAPHLWLTRSGTRIPTHDLFGDRFVLLAGAAAQPWLDAATEIGYETGIPLRGYLVGQATDNVELVDHVNARDTRGTGPRAAALIRPDGYVAWLSQPVAVDTSAPLRQVLHSVLCNPDSTNKKGGNR